MRPRYARREEGGGGKREKRRRMTCGCVSQDRVRYIPRVLSCVRRSVRFSSAPRLLTTSPASSSSFKVRVRGGGGRMDEVVAGARVARAKGSGRCSCAR